VFRVLAALRAPQPIDDVFRFHPIQLARWLEEAWATGRIPPAPAWPIAQPANLGAVVDQIASPDALLNTLPSGVVAGLLPSGSVSFAAGRPRPPGTAPPQPWDHLVYAYLVESTGVIEILAEVVRRFVVGESLGVPLTEAHAWLRATEEGFFRDPPLFHVLGLTSQLRPDARVNRRNAYWRMFAMDLPHPLRPAAGGAEPVPVWRTDVAQAHDDFRATWTELLRLVWVAFANVTNSVGANPTDNFGIGYLCQTLQQQLGMRRLNGNLAREEFAYVTILSWFHLTLDADTAIVRTLRAEATTPAERLSIIGRRVGITPHPHARELFLLADRMSEILRLIESGLAGANPTLLYLPGVIQTTMVEIINLWERATGDRIRQEGYAAAPGRPPARPVPARPPAPAAPAPGPAAVIGAAAPVSAANGQRGS
jgi:hypothetical protein